MEETIKKLIKQTFISSTMNVNENIKHKEKINYFQLNTLTV